VGKPTPGGGKGNQGKGRPGQGRRVFNIICDRCGEAGHIAKFCPAVAPKPMRAPPNAPPKAPPKHEEAVPSGNYVWMPSWQQPYPYPPPPPPPMAAMASRPAAKHSWIVDTGATLHICGDKSLFDEYEEFGEPLPLQAAAGQSCMYGVGKVWLVGMSPTVLCLRDVGYVPNASHNLLLSRQIA